MIVKVSKFQYLSIILDMKKLILNLTHFEILYSIFMYQKFNFEFIANNFLYILF